jgi:hypothetical protein
LRDTALGHLGQPGRGRSTYIVPLTDDELELYDLPASRPATLRNELDDEEAYRQLLITRPLPPTPAASHPRPSTPFPVLASPLSDPFVGHGNTRTETQRPTTLQDGRTVRLVPESSGKLHLAQPHVYALPTNLIVASRI